MIYRIIWKLQAKHWVFECEQLIRVFNYLFTSNEVTRITAYEVEVNQQKCSRFKKFAKKSNLNGKLLYTSKNEEMVKQKKFYFQFLKN